MSYLKDFKTQISNHNYSGFLHLWEEYCASDEVDNEEFFSILAAAKNSEFAELFGRHVERILPVWEKLADSEIKHAIFKLIVDLQTTNQDSLRLFVVDYLQKRYGHLPFFQEKLRLTGLRNKENFQGAVANFELLSHIGKGKFVFHTGGWGVGEIVDLSMVREQLSIEFDNVPGKKDLSFANACKTLVPIPDTHFLALRFGNADSLEQKARENPVEVIRILLRDLGPKTAGEIKDELCELVIPEEEWTKWWQNARAKIKKDTMIESPDDLQDNFVLRRTELAHEERFQKLLDQCADANSTIQTVYAFLRDFSETLKNATFKLSLQSKLQEVLAQPDLTDSQKLGIYFLMQDLSGEKKYPPIFDLIHNSKTFEAMIQAIDIAAFKKRALIEARQIRADWKTLFLNLLFTIDLNLLRDYLIGELIDESTLPDLKRKLEELCAQPQQYPDLFLWYFQEITTDPSLPFADKQGKIKFFESFFILLEYVERAPSYRDLIKKMHNILAAGRYEIVREILKHSSIESAKEFLLLATKCHSLSDHDIKILQSLAEVVHPSLGKLRKSQENGDDSSVIWTTEAGYKKIKERIQQIATVETVETAKEIEIARSHGDLKENAEFKSALEKRNRLQSELKLLSEQINRARILSQADVVSDEVGVGAIVDCKNKENKRISYTLLGPWDADPDRGILSFQSKLAQTMKGLTVGDSFQFQGETFTITDIKSYFDKK